MESDSTGLSSLFTLAASGSSGFQTHDWVLLFFLFLTLIVAAVSAGAETALTSVNRLRIRNLAEEGDANARVIANLLRKPQVFLTTILVISNLAVITGSTLATIIAVDLDFNGATCDGYRSPAREADLGQRRSDAHSDVRRGHVAASPAARECAGGVGIDGCRSSRRDSPRERQPAVGGPVPHGSGEAHS